jgi:hypothetical protein
MRDRVYWREAAGAGAASGVLIVTILLLWSSATMADASSRPVGTNCSLAAPPDDAGEDLSHGMTVRIFPRARDIRRTYSGCQVMWAQSGADGWVILSVVEIEEGDPRRIWSPFSSSPERFACLYKNGQVISGEEKSCASSTFLIQKSMARGCVVKLQAAIGAGGLAAARPQGCEYE